MQCSKVMRVGKDDVPELIQDFEFQWSLMHIEVEFFNGQVRRYGAESFINLDIMSKDLTRMQELEILDRLTNSAEKDFIGMLSAGSIVRRDVPWLRAV